MSASTVGAVSVPTGLDAVQARIATIQQRFGAAPPAGASSVGASSVGASSVGASSVGGGGPQDFRAALADATSGLLAPDVAATVMNGAPSGSDVVADATRYLGVPYRYGGTDPATGLDCSALVQRVYRDLGVTLPRTSAQQATVGAPVQSLAQARPGDLVAFHTPVSHIGIYIGGGRMIVAPHTGASVRVEEITSTPAAIRRVLPETAAQPVEAMLRSLPMTLVGRPGALSGSAPYTALFTTAEQRYHLPAGLLSAVARVESNYRPDAVSSAGAIGLMQLMPSTARALGVDPSDPPQAIDGAARLLRGQLDRFGSVPLALAAYNAGGPAVARYDGIPPYPQTQQYVTKVLSYLGEAS